jgi:alginate O-acetyltransferase complex protein AlgI
MDFNAPIFLFLFLPVFMLVYHLASYRGKLIAGVVGSLLFYSWGNLQYVPLLAGLALATYGVARWFGTRKGSGANGAWLWVSLLAGVGLLVGFKLSTHVPYPLGLSYLTFQALAYLLEIHHNRISAEPDLLRFSFYLLLFPKIPVGPIVRYSSVKEQIAELKPQPAEMADGLRRFIRGLAKKVLIADTLARVVNPIFLLDSPTIPPSWARLVLISYALQLFFDFSGYTDMAIGLGRMLGLTFLENFNFPYLSRSIGDFWRRWHISLASWFRDFVFFPLERRRLKWIGQPLNILVVFLLVGLWHGLAIPFVVWGLMHGLALAFESTTLGRRLTGLRPPISNLYALTVILAGWVFFRAPTLQFALAFFGRLAGNTAGVRILSFERTMPLPFVEPTYVMALAAGLILCFPVGQWLERLVQRLVTPGATTRLFSQILYDLGAVATLTASLAAIASTTFAPGIYASF